MLYLFLWILVQHVLSFVFLGKCTTVGVNCEICRQFCNSWTCTIIVSRKYNMYRHRLFLVHVPCVVACEVHVPFVVGFGTCTIPCRFWYMYQGLCLHTYVHALYQVHRRYCQRKRRVAGERAATFLGGLLGKELSLFDLGRVAGERAATFLCWGSGYGASLCTFRRLITRGLTSRPVYLMLCIVMVIN